MATAGRGDRLEQAGDFGAILAVAGDLEGGFVVVYRPILLAHPGGARIAEHGEDVDLLLGIFEPGGGFHGLAAGADELLLFPALARLFHFFEGFFEHLLGKLRRKSLSLQVFFDHFQHPFQLFAGPVQSPLHRAQGDVEEGGDLRVAQAAQIVEGDGQAVIVGEAIQGTANLRADFCALELLGGRRIGAGNPLVGLLERVVVSAPAQPHAAAVEGELAQPAGEAFRVAQLAQFEIGGDECFLGDVLGVVEAAGQVIGQAVDGSLVAADELAEALGAAGQGLCDQLCIVGFHHRFPQ